MESASVILDRKRKNFWPDLRREPRDHSLRSIAARSGGTLLSRWKTTNFNQHSGYDLFGIARAALVNFVSGHVRQGASTITQQLARNSFCPEGKKPIARKLLEIYVAERIEQHFGKQKIMELYLNRIYFGGGPVWRGKRPRARFTSISRRARDVADGMRHFGWHHQKSESAFTLVGPGGRRANHAMSRSAGWRDLGFIDRPALHRGAI